MTESTKDDEVIWVLIKIKYYIFTQYFRRYKNTIADSENCLTELEIQAGFSKFAQFCKRVGSILIYFIFNFLFVSIFTRGDLRTGRPMDFTPEVEDEFISEAVSQKLDRPLVNPPNKVWRDSTQTKNPPSPFHIGVSLRYTN